VAEKSWQAWRLQIEGKLQGDDGGILFDHREAPADTDPADRRRSRSGSRCRTATRSTAPAGGSAERIVQDYWDPDTEPAVARRFYLNQFYARGGRVARAARVGGVRRVDKVVADGEMITLGFDGSRRRARGVTDATALIACRVSDGHLFDR
jgi:hypothetical protein